MLTFVHLSDLHLQEKRTDTIHDLDSDVRNELLRDIGRQLVSAATGILISGDLAFGGKPAEYALARQFLSRVCVKAGCHEENVWTIPGNHDVNQDLQIDDTAGDALRKQLRDSVEKREQDELIRRTLQGPSSGVLLGPLADFNTFARGYQCDVKPDIPFWERDFELGAGYSLRVRGVNSTLTSGRRDRELDLVLGKGAATMSTRSGVAYLFMCHHPPTWLRDHEAVENLISRRASLQLYGHRHTQNVMQHGNTSVRLFSGALHPDRQEVGWVPRYNILKIGLASLDSVPAIDIRIHARVWNDDSAGFVADSITKEGIHEYKFPFHEPLTDTRPTMSGSDGREPPTRSGSDVGQLIASSPPRMDPRRRAVFLFYDLPQSKQERVVAALGFSEVDPSASAHPLGYDDVFAKVERSNRWPLLWKLIQEEHGHVATSSDNPFGSA